MSGSVAARRAAKLAVAAGLGVAAWEVVRRSDARKLAADPEHAELSRTLQGRAVEAVSADGTRLHAEVFGPEDAPSIVLAHGWTCSNQFWHHQIRDLSREFRVVAYDQRGHGRSQAPQGGQYSEDALGDDLQAVLDACVPNGQRAVLVGHSMGGMTVVSWAGGHADQVRSRAAGAVLVSTGMGDLLEQLLVLKPRWGRRLHTAVTPRIMGAPARLPRNSTPIGHRLFRYVAYGPRASEGAVAFGERMLLDCPAPVRAGCARFMNVLDLYTSVPKLDVPTVVIVGDKDRLTPPWHAHRLAEALPQLSELVELPEVGHMAPLEAPEEVTRRIAELARTTLRERTAAVAG